jgi:hypothetical protein
MKALWIALGIVGTIPLVAAAQYPAQSSVQASRSVIKPVGFIHGFGNSDCGCNTAVRPGCAAAPGCCTPVPPPSIGNCCPKPCLLERMRRGLRSLDCLLPCGLGCHSINCHSSCGGGGCSSCSASCETKSSCGSCCTKSRAHFFAFCKPKCGSPCGGVSCSTPCQVGCSHGVPAETYGPPVPPADDNPFKDDVRPMDPNAPPSGQSTYKPYFKKNNTTAHSGPQLRPTPAKLDPYAVAPPVHIKARPVQAPVPAPAPLPGKYASRMPAAERVNVAVAQEVETVSLVIADDEPPAPPMALPVSTTAKRIESRQIDRSIPVNPLR